MECHPDWENETVISIRNRIEVTANGKTCTEERAQPRGGVDSGVTDKELEEKFRHNVSRILFVGQIDGAVKHYLAWKN